MSQPQHRVTAILPCRDIGRSQAFYERVGLHVQSNYGNYLILSDGHGWHLHLNEVGDAVPAAPDNPFGLYLYVEDVDGVAARLAGEIIGKGPETKSWGCYEFAVSDPDGTLVRIGRIV